MQYSKVKIIRVEKDNAQVYEDGKPVPGKLTPRIRAIVIPVKPDSMAMNITSFSNEIIQTFKSLEGQVVMFPSTLGVTENGTLYLQLDKSITVDEIDVIAEKPAQRSSSMPPINQNQTKAA